MSEEDIEAQARELVAITQEELVECEVDLGLALEVARELVPAIDAPGYARDQAAGVASVLRKGDEEWGIAAFVLLLYHTIELYKKGRGV